MATISHLAEQLQREAVELLRRSNLELYEDFGKWRLESDGLYCKGVRRKRLIGVNLQDAIRQLPSYKDLVDALKKDAVYGKRLNKLQAIHSLTSTVTAESYIDGILVNEKELLLQKPYQAKKIRTEFLKELVAKDYTVRLVTPILGLRTSGGIILDSTTKLISHNKEDTIKCLNWGLISTPFPDDLTYWVNPMHSGISFLVTEYRHPIISGRHATDAEVDISRKFRDKHEWIKNGLQMTFDLHGYEVNIGKTIVTCDYLLMPGESILNPEVTPYAWRVDRQLILNRSLGGALSSTFRLVDDSTNKSNSMLRLACSRLALARHRKSDEDSFLDLMIACEAFYMNNESDHTDISYKLRIRAAMWYSGQEYSKCELMSLFSKAYDVRSRIAHGSKPDKMKFREREISVRGLFEIVEDILKSGLLKYMKILDAQPSSYVHAWEDVVIDQ